MNDVTSILSAIEHGEPMAAEQLLPLVYDELRRLAAQKLAEEAPGQTVQATALVHEAYVRLVGKGCEQPWNGRGHFFAAAAEAMRRILVENARRKKALKHGGDLSRRELDGERLIAPEPREDLLALDAALNKLAASHSQAADLVQLRYFAGLTLTEAAEALDISPRTAGRLWTYARAWLRPVKSTETETRPDILENAWPGFLQISHCEIEAMRRRAMGGSRAMTEQANFLAALEIADPAERSAYLDRACVGDAALRDQVDALLAAYDRCGAFLEVPACEQMAVPVSEPDQGCVAPEANVAGEATVAEPDELHDPDATESEPHDDDEPGVLALLQPSTRPDAVGRLEHYEVLEVLGKGGFGIVLKAFDEMLHRVVAIKILAPRLASTSRLESDSCARPAPPPPSATRTWLISTRSRSCRPLPRHGVHRRRDPPAEDRSGRAARGDGGAAHRPADRRGARRGPRHGADPPRHQAEQHPAGKRRRAAGQDHRLRPGPRRRRRQPDAKRLHRRHADVHGARSRPWARRSTIAPTSSASAACFMSCAVAGRRFAPPSMLAVLKRVVDDTPRPIPEIIPEVPEWLCAIVERLHAKNPSDRFNSAKELADLLARYEAHLHRHEGVPPLPTASRTATQPVPATCEPVESALPRNEASPNLGSQAAAEVGRSGKRRIRWLVALVALVALAVLVSAGVALVRALRPPHSEAPADPRARSFFALADQPWQDTGVDAVEGEAVVLSPKGTWRKGQQTCARPGAWSKRRGIERSGPKRPSCVCWSGSATNPRRRRCGSARSSSRGAAAACLVQANDLDLQRNSDSLELTVTGGLCLGDAAPRPGLLPIQAADRDWKPIEARAEGTGANPDQVREELFDFCQKYAGTPQASPAARMLQKLPLVNSIGMRLALIPPGEFMMGSDATDSGAGWDEFLDKAAGRNEKHRVRITRPFYLGVTEVTRGQFREFADNAGYKTEAEKDGTGASGVNNQKGSGEANPKPNWLEPRFEQTDEHPVVIRELERRGSLLQVAEPEGRQNLPLGDGG